MLAHGVAVVCVALSAIRVRVAGWVPVVEARNPSRVGWASAHLQGPSTQRGAVCQRNLSEGGPRPTLRAHGWDGSFAFFESSPPDGCSRRALPRRVSLWMPTRYGLLSAFPVARPSARGLPGARFDRGFTPAVKCGRNANSPKGAERGSWHGGRRGRAGAVEPPAHLGESQAAKRRSNLARPVDGLTYFAGGVGGGTFNSEPRAESRPEGDGWTEGNVLAFNVQRCWVGGGTFNL